MVAMADGKDADVYPALEIFVLALCRFAEPCAFTSIFPYLYYFVKSFGYEDESTIGLCVGVVSSTFAICEFLTAFFWGRMSDKYGRKPIILFSAGATVIPFVAFGFSKSLWMAVFWRALTGLVNGNAPVIRTMIAELVPNRKFHAKAFAVMPIVWSVGSTIGPMIGGSLADPAHTYPSVFGNSKFFIKYPFALPNIVAGALFAMSFLVGFFFIRETHQQAKRRTDYGVLFKDRLVARIKRWVSRSSPAHASRPHDDYERADVQDNATPSSAPPKPPPFAMRDAFVPQVVLNIALHAMFGFHSIAFDAMFPLFASTSRSSGGLEISARAIGYLMTVAGCSYLLVQIWVFPIYQARYGSIKCFRYSNVVFVLVYLLVPLLSFTRSWFMYVVAAILLSVAKAAVAFAFPCNVILLTQATPALYMLGTVNGMAQSLVSLSRGVGPLSAGPVWALLVATGTTWMLWIFFALFVSISIVLSYRLIDVGALKQQQQQQAAADMETTREGNDDYELSSRKHVIGDSDSEDEVLEHLISRDSEEK